MGPHDPPTAGLKRSDATYNAGFIQYKCENSSLDQHGHSSTFASVLSSPSLPSACSPSIQLHTALATENSANDKACAIFTGSCGLLSQSTSLGSLPSLTFTPSCTLVSSASPAYNHIKHQYHCIQTHHLLDAGHISCLVATGGRYLYGASSCTSTLYVWSMEELNKGHQVQIPTCIEEKLANNVAGTKDGGVRTFVTIGEDMIVSAHDSDKKIRIWKRLASHNNGAQIMHVAETLMPAMALSYHTSLKLLSTMPTLKDYLRTFLLHKDYVQVRRHHKKLWIEHVDTISSLAVSRDKQLLYSASWDRSIKVWRLPQFKCLESVRRAHEDAINCMVLSNDGKFLYTGSADAKIKVWRCQADQRLDGAKIAPRNHTGPSLKTMPLAQSMLSTFEGHKSAVNALALSPNGGVLYSGAGDKAIIVWEREESAAHMVIAGTLRGHRQAILCLATVTSPHHEMERDDVDSRQAHMLCSGSADKTIRVWKSVGLCMQRSSSVVPDVPSMKQHKYWCVGVLEGHTAPVKCLSVSCVSHVQLLYVYSASLDKTMKTWRISFTGTPPKIMYKN